MSLSAQQIIHEHVGTKNTHIKFELRQMIKYTLNGACITLKDIST